MSHKIFNFFRLYRESSTKSGQFSIFNCEQGATTIMLAFFVMSALLMVSLTASGIMIYQIQMSRDIANSIPAFYAADAGAEECLYQARKEVDNQECNKNNGDLSPSPGILSNGAQFDANRQNKTITAWGTFGGTRRKVELTW